MFLGIVGFVSCPGRIIDGDFGMFEGSCIGVMVSLFLKKVSVPGDRLE